MRILAGGPRASPTQFRKVFLRTVGEGLKVNRPKAERSHPGVCPSRGPASVQPLRKQRGRNQIRRRGGPCGRLYSRCESWRAHAMRPYWFPVDCRGGYQPPQSLPLGEGGICEAVTDEGNGFVHPHRPVRAAGPVNYLLSRSRSSGTTKLGVRPEK